MRMPEKEGTQAMPGIPMRIFSWIDARFPLSALWKSHASGYPVPKNLNFLYVFGWLGILVLAIQLVTGIVLVMHYKPDAGLAFASIEYIMRDVPWGWLVRYMHSTGASAFFIVIYLHMVRGLLYGSYRKPRELVWLLGMVTFLCLMAEAFFGYLLPWGQMSYWGAQVIINLFDAIPFVGPDMALWIRGDYVVSDATLGRFYALHVIVIPLALIALVIAHVVALHEVGSSNPDGIDMKEKTDKNSIPPDSIPFYPYYFTYDLFVATIFLALFFAVVFFAPEMGGYFLEYNNFIPADPLQTPDHITPVWYFAPFYAMLRAVTPAFMQWQAWGMAAYVVLVILTSKQGRWGKIITATIGLAMIAALFMLEARFWGAAIMAGSVIILFALPWLDRCQVKSIRYRPAWHRWLYFLFFATFVLLGFLGVQTPSLPNTLISQIGVFFYFGFFLLMPWWSKTGKCKPVPKRLGAVTYKGI